MQTKEEYEFMQYIKPMRLKQKLDEFGQEFLIDCVALLKLRDEKKIIRAIQRTIGYKRKILMAETFFHAIKEYQTINQSCPKRLKKKGCSESRKKCSFFNCSGISLFI